MANGKLVNTMNSVHRRSYTADDLRFASGRARGCPRLRAGVGKAPAWLPCASGRSLRPKPSPFFAVSLPLFSRRHYRSSVEPSPSNQRLCHHNKVLNSFASSLCTHPTGRSRLTSPNFAARRLSSPRPAASPSSVPRHGQRVTVSLCPC